METAVKKIKPIEKKEGGASEEKEPIFEIKTHKYHENPKVSVIVPVYKVDKYLTQCLNSIVNQTMEELEIIIVDEGDQDRCREIIDFFEKNDPRIVAPHQKNGGDGASCNLGMDMARGEYIAIVESDDYIEPEMYEEMYEYAKALDADVVKTPYYECFANGEKHMCRYAEFVAASVPTHTCFSLKEYGTLLEVHASLWTGLYRTSYMREKNIRFICAKGGAYVDVGFRIETLIHSDKIAWLDKAYYDYRIDSEGSTTNNFEIGPMIQRWREMHEMFSGVQKDYDDYYGGHILLDEYYNTIGWLALIDVTDEEFKAIQGNMEYVNAEVIENSTCLNKAQKKEIMLFKTNPAKFKRNAAKKRFLHKHGGTIMGVLDWISSFTLMKYFLVALAMSWFAPILFPTVETGAKYLSIVFFFGIGLCFFLKVVRKAIYVYWKYRGENTK